MDEDECCPRPILFKRFRRCTDCDRLSFVPEPGPVSGPREGEDEDGGTPGPEENGSGHEGVDALLGDPRKNLMKLALPVMVSFLVHSLYSFVDSIWLSFLPGQAAQSLAAIGYVFPLMFFMIAITYGMGMGVNAVVAQRIGASDKAGADAAAKNAFALYIIGGIIASIGMTVFARPLMRAIGAGEVLDQAVAYGQIVYSGLFFFFIGQGPIFILRGEGDTKRPMYAMVSGSVMNMVLDPILIFGAGWGLEGAAAATVVSRTLTAVYMLWWIFVRKGTYLDMSLRGFHFQWDTIRAIFRIGIPTAFAEFIEASTMLLFNAIITLAAGADGVSVAMAGFRLIAMAGLPNAGISSAVVSVAGAAWGAKDHAKMRLGLITAWKWGFAIQLVTVTLMFTLAPLLAGIFTQDTTMAHLHGEITVMLRIMGLTLFMASFFLPCWSAFQGAGFAGTIAFLTIYSSILVSLPAAYLIAIVADVGLSGVWWGMIVGDAAVALICFPLLLKRGIWVRGTDKDDWCPPGTATE